MRVVGADAGADLVAVNAREVPVEDHHVGGFEHLERLRAVVGNLGLQAVRGAGGGDGVGEVGLVFHN